MRRVLIVAICLLSLIGAAGARPVLADNSVGDEGSSVSSWVRWTGDQLEKSISAPEGWYRRSVCVGNMGTNQAWCVYFPWPI